MNYEREASQLLRRLGANSSYVGFYYVTYGVSQQNIQKPELITFITKGLYAEIAIKYQTTVGCVERDMRTVNTIWQHGNRELLEIIFERNLTRKPRNGEFIDTSLTRNLDECLRSNGSSSIFVIGRSRSGQNVVEIVSIHTRTIDEQS